MFERYAIYFTPRPPLAEIGAAWLGWDVARGTTIAHPDIAGVDVAHVTATPRKYGLHATIKPPMFLTDGTDAEQLQSELTALCATLAPVKLDGLKLARLSGFLALVPEGEQGALAALAARVVTALDHFRAPPGEAELARRRESNLSPAQEQHLKDWGYPYVMDQFRFHMTLSGRLDRAEAERIMATITPHFAPHLPRPFLVDSLTLAGQDSKGLFHQISQTQLTG